MQTTERTIDLPSTQIHVNIVGDLSDGRPVVLLGHSYLWTHDMWREQLDTLSQQFNCVVPDLPAHGQSGVIENKQYDIDSIAQLYWELMQALNVNKFAVVGLSIGGMWGTALAAAHPDNVTHLAIMDSFVGAEPDVTREKYFALLEQCEANGFDETMLETLLPFFLTPDSIKNNKPLVERFKQHLLNTPQTRRSHICELGRHIFSRPCHLKHLATLSMPVKIMVGEHDVPRPPSESKLMTEQCPTAELAVIKNAAHISSAENPNEVNAILSEFLLK
jgi:pimeloyl-ACP methyl ester carboxylesterase